LPDVVVILKENSIVEYVNAAAARELSVVPERTIGQPLFEALPVDPVVRRQIQKELDLAVAGQSPRWWQPTSGTARRDPLAPVPSDGPPREFRIADRIYRYRIFGLAAGTDSTRLGLVLRDVTGEHQLQDQLIQADKLAGLGTLTAGIAHEINNPLFVVMGLAETLEAEPDLNKTTDTARDIVKYAKHMASVIKNFSRYTTPNATEPLAPVDLNRTVADAVSMAQLADGTATIEVESSYQPLPPVMARPEELQQVFLNIIVNAIQAMKGHGRLRVETDSADGWVQVRITDNGPGIPKTFVGKIFDPFFTTKEPGKGTGLGLNIVYQIVTKYGGTISVSSEEGHGARFTVGFPAMVPVV